MIQNQCHYGIETGNLRRNLLSLFNNIFFCLNGYKYVFKQYNSHGKVLEAIWVLPGTSSGSSTASLEGGTTISNFASCQHLSLVALWLQGIWIHFLRSHNPLNSQICCQGPPVARQLHPLNLNLDENCFFNTGNILPKVTKENDIISQLL